MNALTRAALALAVLTAGLTYFLAVDQRAQAYTLTGFTYDHTAITYDDPIIGHALAYWIEVSGLTDGGLVDSSVADITLERPQPWPFGSGVAGAAGPREIGPGGTMVQCVIYLPSWQTIGGVTVHEVGHCLGLAHSEYADQNMAAYCCNPIGWDDVAGIQALYGPPQAIPSPTPDPTPPSTWRAFIPAVGRD